MKVSFLETCRCSIWSAPFQLETFNLKTVIKTDLRIMRDEHTKIEWLDKDAFGSRFSVSIKRGLNVQWTMSILSFMDIAML